MVYYFLHTRVKKVGKLGGILLLTYKDQKSRQTRWFFTTVVLMSNTSSSTTAYGPLLRLSGRTPLLRSKWKLHHRKIALGCWLLMQTSIVALIGITNSTMKWKTCLSLLLLKSHFLTNITYFECTDFEEFDWTINDCPLGTQKLTENQVCPFAFCNCFD